MLRDGTFALHRRVDKIFSRSDLSRRADYVDFLSAQAAALMPTENALDQAGAGNLLPGWNDRKRSALLRADLHSLGAAVPELYAAPTFSTAAETWGGIYVLEGSRLGAALLRRSVAPGLPAAFLNAMSPAARWSKLLDKLNGSLANSTEIALAMTAAQRVFVLFELAGLQFIRSGKDRIPPSF